MPVDGKIQIPTQDVLDDFKKWLVGRGYAIHQATDSWEALRFSVSPDVATCSFQKLGKKRTWRSHNGAEGVWTEFLMSRKRRELTMSSLKPKLFCKDCKFHTWDKTDSGKTTHFCTCPPLLDMVTGWPTEAQKCRNTATLCGVDAKYFIAKETAMTK